MKILKISIVLIGLLISCIEGQSQVKFNTLYGNQYTCVSYYMLPGYECILRSPKDSLLVTAANYMELGSNTLSLAKDGTMLTSFTEGATYKVINYIPYFAKIKVNPYGTILLPLCGQMQTIPVPQIAWQSYFSSCIGKDGRVYLGGIQTENDTIPFLVKKQTAHYTTLGYLGNVSLPGGPGNALKYYGFGGYNNRCMKIIPDDWGLCMVGEFDCRIPDTLVTTDHFEPGTGINKFKDSAFYLMRVDKWGHIKSSKFYQHTGTTSSSESDAMTGILRDSIFGFVTAGHIKLLSGGSLRDRMHITRVDTNLNIRQSFSLRHGTAYTEGMQIIKANGNVIVGMGNYIDSLGFWTPFIVSFNPSNLVVNWAYRFPLSFAGSRVSARAWNIIQTSGAAGFRFVLVGTSSRGMFMLCSDPTGGAIWSKAYGGERGFSVVETSDHGYAAAGDHYRCTPGGQDLSVYCVRTDGGGKASCPADSFSVSVHDVLFLARDTVALDTSSALAVDSLNFEKDCSFGGYMEQYTVCPECCFDPYSQTVKMLDTNAHCIGDTFCMTGLQTNKYRFEWYVNGQLYSSDTMIKYVFKAEGSYSFDIHIILKSNPKCILKGCAQAFILPGNKGFSYIKLTNDTIQLAYNDSLGHHEFYWQWQFDDGYSVTGYAGSPTDDQLSPKHHLSVGMHKACLTVRTGDASTYCESTVCKNICVGSDPTHNCCSTCQ